MKKAHIVWLNQNFAGLRRAIEQKDKEAFEIILDILVKNWDILTKTK